MRSIEDSYYDKNWRIQHNGYSESFIEKVKKRTSRTKKGIPSTRILTEYDKNIVIAKKFELNSERNHEIK